MQIIHNIENVFKNINTDFSSAQICRIYVFVCFHSLIHGYSKLIYIQCCSILPQTFTLTHTYTQKNMYKSLSYANKLNKINRILYDLVLNYRYTWHHARTFQCPD